MKPDERALLKAMATVDRRNVDFDKVADRLGIPRDRADYLARKWSNKGWYDYGVSVRFGWLTAEGLEAAREKVASA